MRVCLLLAGAVALFWVSPAFGQDSEPREAAQAHQGAEEDSAEPPQDDWLAASDEPPLDEPEPSYEHEEPADGEASGPGAAPYVVMGAGAVLVGISAVTGVMALSISDDLEEACSDSTCPEDRLDDRDEGANLALATDLLLIAGGATVVVGLLWALVAKDSGSNVSATCSGDGCALSLAGVF